MRFLLLFLCLSPQAQNAEAKKLLDALAPPLKDPSYSQLEWELGPVKWVGHFSRQKAWRLDRKADERDVFYLFDGKEFLEYKKYANSFRRTKGESMLFLLGAGGGLAEIYYSGNADRLLKDAKQVTLKKEKLADVECSHVTIFKKDPYSESEFHFWIDPDKSCKRFQRKVTSQGKPNESTWTYKVVDPPTTTEETFTIQIPADAKDLNSRDK